MTEEDQSNYRETDQSVRGLRTYQQADSIRELTQRGLDARKQGDNFSMRIDERPDGLFDLLVFQRVN